MWPFPSTPNYDEETSPPPAPSCPSGSSTVVESRPVPTGAARIVEVEIGSPEIPATETVTRGPSVVVAIPDGASMYRLAFAPLRGSEPLTALPFSTIEPDVGRLKERAGQLTVTPIWMRHGKQHVEAGDVATSLLVIFR